MSVTTALAAYLLAASLLTITPGLDTALVLRAAGVGPMSGARAALGVTCGLIVWGASAALGLGAVVTASPQAFLVLKWAGAIYLGAMGLQLILRPRNAVLTAGAGPTRGWWRRGFLTNLLNPKVGAFYVSFLPQFVPAHVAPTPFLFLLALIHAALGVVWFAALIAAIAPLRRLLARPAVVRLLDRASGIVFLGFGARLAFERS
jgi:threonine/homoserine/homoserine lactone efflux protein